MRYAPATAVPGDEATKHYLDGPRAVPGTYNVSLSADGSSQSASFRSLKDQRISATQDDLDEQFTLLTHVRDLVSETHETILSLRRVRAQIEAWVGGWESGAASDDQNVTRLKEHAAKILSTLEEIELALIQPKSGSSLQFPEALNSKLAKLSAFIGLDDARPTRQAYEVFDELSEQIRGHLERFRKTVTEDVRELNDGIRRAGLPLIAAAPIRE